jgi:hypothetical protein
VEEQGTSASERSLTLRVVRIGEAESGFSSEEEVDAGKEKLSIGNKI